MRVLPVIDLKQGVVVRGVAGKRESYRPIESGLAASSTPSAIAVAFASKLAAQDVYVADLEALGGAEPDWQSYGQIAAAGLKLWVDCGIRTVERARAVADYARRENSLAGIIVALESAPSPIDLPVFLAQVGLHQGVFSLDLQAGVALNSSPAWQGLSPFAIATRAWQAGFRRMVVVDLAQVGVGQGPSVAPLCRELKHAYPDLELTAGGGVRSLGDVRLLAEAGCDRVLVASALHDGRLTRAELAEL